MLLKMLGLYSFNLSGRSRYLSSCPFIYSPNTHFRMHAYKIVVFRMDCTHCSKPYKFAEDCYQHIRREHGVEPLAKKTEVASDTIKCTHCAKSFKFAKNCYAYLRKAHGVDPIAEKKKSRKIFLQLHLISSETLNATAIRFCSGCDKICYEAKVLTRQN